MVRGIVSGGGKRLRPLILLLATNAFSPITKRAITAAAGIELLHTASLVHDDNIDRAAMRRGNPTLNTELSSGAVILVGDYLFAQSAILAAATELPRVVMIFATSLAEICDGQLLETLEAHQLDQTLENYERRIYGKTAALFAASAEMGAVIGGADDDAVRQLRQYGVDLGMAFQIVDDVLDLREGSQAIGKPAGNDLRQGVITYPVMRYMASLPANASDRVTIARIVAGDETDDDAINTLVATIKESDAIDQAIELAQMYASRARANLTMVPDQSIRTRLDDLVDIVITRSS